MDCLSYDFLDKVLTNLDHHTIRELHLCELQSLLWNDVARLYQTQVQPLQLVLAASPNRLSCSFSNYSSETEGVNYTFDQMRKLDPRFKRVLRFVAGESNSPYYWNPTDHNYELSMEQIPEMIHLLCHHPVADITVNLHDKFAKIRNLIIAAFEKHIINMELYRLDLLYSAESMNFLRISLQQDSLEQLTMKGHWPPDFKEDLLAFVQRPRFSTLTSWSTQLFDIDDIKLIIALRKNVENPGHYCQFRLKTDCDFSDAFVSWKLIETTLTGAKTYEDHYKKLAMNVRCESGRLVLTLDEEVDDFEKYFLNRSRRSLC